jgi:hypothetical protein
MLFFFLLTLIGNYKGDNLPNPQEMTGGSKIPPDTNLTIKSQTKEVPLKPGTQVGARATRIIRKSSADTWRWPYHGESKSQTILATRTCWGCCVVKARNYSPGINFGLWPPIIGFLKKLAVTEIKH